MKVLTVKQVVWQVLWVGLPAWLLLVFALGWFMEEVLRHSP